ncbi:MAG TPA: SusD/RagB family nutrient-binding outer membrane lipoprotein, partial [Chitinophagaceae bacterium]|nr:SusD/RagB family nutrient-binding outer membrane lipoprotein [Chitinophagaceae bacterium]
NPNKPTDELITPDFILPLAQHNTASRMATQYDFAAHWLGRWARSGSYGPSAEQESYRITNNYQAAQWSGWYGVLNDVNTMEKKADESGQEFYEGIAKVLKTIGFMNLVDMYNNVPYKNAFDLAGNILPSYDKGEDIYKDLLVQLDSATALIKRAKVSENLNLTTADIMFHGDATMWRKLINTQRLKLLIHQSQIPGFNPASEIAKITADGSGFIGSGETASVQPGYVQDNLKQNPFYDTYEKNYKGELSDAYNRANNYVLGLFRNNDDIRYQYFFDAAQAPIAYPAGSPVNTYYGYNFGESIPNSAPAATNSSGVGGKGLARSADQAQWLFTSVESLFLQAEAIQRGWLPGVAKTAYENAVRESFIWLGVTNAVATANTYLASGTAIVDWNQATTPDAKVRLIATQKYLALVGINNLEAWTDYRRLGVPAVPLSMNTAREASIPVRLRYPQNEYNYNAPNVTKENDPDPITSPIFWDK